MTRSRSLFVALLFSGCALAVACTAYAGPPINLGVALQDDADPADIEALRQLLEDDPRVDRCEFVLIQEAGIEGEVLETDYPGDDPLQRNQLNVHLAEGCKESDVLSLVGLVESFSAFESTVLPELDADRWWWTW